jgi:DNA-directed RNA polymerase subunit N (RpoN/RPB10)
VKREVLEALCAQGLTQRAIAERLGVSHSTARYWLKRFGLRTHGRPVAKAWDEGAFLEACAASATIAEVLDRIGVSKYSGNYRRAADYAERLGTVLPMARRDAWSSREPKPMLSDEQVRARFRRTEIAQDSKSLKRWMVRRLGVMNRCVGCGIHPEWNGKPLTLELDHIDGDRLNNELANLRLLCPNCHAQTETSNRRK